MGENDFELGEAYYQQLLNVARSACLDLSEDRGKDDLVARLDDAGVERVGHDEWEQNGEPLELLPVQTGAGSSGPRDRTVLYCLTRKETTAERVEEIRSALEGIGYELREAGSEDDKYAIVLPAEKQEGPESESNSGEQGNPSAQGEEPEESMEDREEGESGLAKMTRDELYEMAQEKDINGRSEMTKDELVDALASSE